MNPEELRRYGYTWQGRGKPAELPAHERRQPDDPYCPVWCPYRCTGDWKTGQCLIRIPEAVAMLKVEP